MSRFQRGIEPWATAVPVLALYRESTLLEALRFDDDGGSSDVEVAGRRLLRAMAASYLNAGYENLEFPYRRYSQGSNGNPALVFLLQDALASGEPEVLRSTAERLEAANALGCPL